MAVPRLPRSAAGNVLGLDLGTATGWALGSFEGQPRFGAVALRGEDAVHRMAALREWMDSLDALQPISALVLEAALAGEHSGAAAAEVLLSLQAMAALWAYDLEIPVVRVASSSARKAVLGTGVFPKGTAKERVMEWCRGNGFPTASRDAADALVVWLAVRQSTLGLQPAPPGQLLAAQRA